ncbi:hypothetical protein HB834_00295 [Listeria booriae]|uniref:hypothetical protein n=1 Tax=Listeria booriae TaxID=1552123 RepID=UPI00164D6B51|nr:hypothetical protein [Listeria booriae]MBC6150086.1 hypothetical protein [Listeria booriae]
MKTKEFKKAVEALDLVVRETDYAYLIDGDKCYNSIASVSKVYKAVMRVTLRTYDVLDGKQTDELFELLTAYASTPLDEREEPKKWYLRDPVISDKHKNYLAISKHYKNVRHFGWETPIRDYQTKFTRAEIDAFEFEHAHLIEDEVTE